VSVWFFLKIDLQSDRLEQSIDLGSLRTVSSTGSVLPARVCEWFYDSGFPEKVHLVSASGGTDLACSRKGSPVPSDACCNLTWNFPQWSPATRRVRCTLERSKLLL
jgi:acyl-coenzyme A synthetase/AMP-(fatty) acid ligase